MAESLQEWSDKVPSHSEAQTWGLIQVPSKEHGICEVIYPALSDNDVTTMGKNLKSLLGVK